ncbi:SH3 domain-containing protein [Aquibium microcysteis]|uniref:SH3 domain-containing protein n=1 Tax=Aquibium microcysteis TaxID=675281 RepID=UPI00165CFFBF|nr:SH3 domain-containing protein [Aquibium microcysteis]
MTEQEKPVAIFLPQHRPGRSVGPSKPALAAVVATVTILGGSLFFMMPRGDIATAPVAAAAPEVTTPVRSVAVEKEAGADAAGAVAPDRSEAMATEASGVAEPAAKADPAPVAVAKAAKVVDIPRKDDPRWARTEARHGSPALEAMRKLIVEKAAPVDENASGLLAYAGGVERSDFAPAEEPRRPMQIVLPAELPEQPDDAARTASVNAPVNMRKGPGSKHGVMMVIPRRAKVDVYDCDLWCKVGYEGRTGYIYKSFVSNRS